MKFHNIKKIIFHKNYNNSKTNYHTNYLEKIHFKNKNCFTTGIYITNGTIA